MGLVLLLIFLFHGLHVLGDVAAEDAVGEGGGVEIGVGALLLGGFVAGETLAVVGDVETAISGALHGGENFGANGGADETDVKEGLFLYFTKQKTTKWASVERADETKFTELEVSLSGSFKNV